jgi:hypothetical protein
MNPNLMPSEPSSEVKFEIGHVLFIDIVGYSKLVIHKQRALLDTLNRIVRCTEQFQRAEQASRLIKIPTGDGMALVFTTVPKHRSNALSRLAARPACWKISCRCVCSNGARMRTWRTGDFWVG